MACSTLSTQAQAALSANATLQFNAGSKDCVLGGTPPSNCTYGVTTTLGSYFSMDSDGNGSVSDNERTVISMNNGIILGTTQDASGSHSGVPDGSSENPGIDSPWSFFGNTGMHRTTSAITILSDDGAGNVTLDFAGWNVTWNGITSIPMGGDTANFPTDDGTAVLTCYTDSNSTGAGSEVDCTNGTFFILSYPNAHVPLGDASGFGGVAYTVYLEGTISVPNSPPTAGNVTISEAPAASFTWTPVVSDNDAGQTLSCSIGTDGSNGTASVQSDCSAGTYTPTGGAGFTGTDSFTYTVNDGNGGTATGTVSVSIQANPVPACPDFTVIANSGSTSTISLNTGANACSNSPDNTTLAVTSPSTQGGTVTVDTATQTASYTPAFGFSGTDTFTYTIGNAGGTSPAATVTVTVQAVAGNEPTTPSGTLSCGSTAIGAGSSNCVVTPSQIGVADNGSSAKQGIAQSCIGGCFDFEVSNLTSGGDAQIVLGLSTPIPTAASGNSIVYRKLSSTGWTTFDTSGSNAIASVPAASANCPPATDPSYDLNPGLAAGNQCIRLTITDGGPNDSDGVADGTVTDPGGVAESFSIDTRTSGTSGCSMSSNPVNASQRADWWLVAGFMGLLGLFRLKRRKV